MRVYEAQKGETHMKQTAMLTTASLFTIGREIGNSSEAFFFVWVLLALGIR